MLIDKPAVWFLIFLSLTTLDFCFKHMAKFLKSCPFFLRVWNLDVINAAYFLDVSLMRKNISF